MAILTCGSCNRVTRTPDNFIGQAVECPHCRTRGVITPEAPPVAASDARSESLDFLATPPALPPRRTERHAPAPIPASAANPAPAANPAAMPLWASIIIGAIYGMLGAATALGVLLYIVDMGSANSAPQQAAIAAMHAAQFIAGYILARCAEKIVRAFAQR